ncbi:serine/threonine protein kinase [Corchorus olitorius]|uniref:Serine/threonine protein kinase n=1 Tax=Corchorus olitorius TaxID=93759 RepID=A0A1R3JVK8_9ROSI|nr:serine/threonine protein kinase [Corchorus olitorius]
MLVDQLDQQDASYLVGRQLSPNGFIGFNKIRPQYKLVWYAGDIDALIKLLARGIPYELIRSKWLSFDYTQQWTSFGDMGMITRSKECRFVDTQVMEIVLRIHARSMKILQIQIARKADQAAGFVKRKL